MKAAATLAALCLAAACHGAERPADHAALAPITASGSEGLQRLHLPLAVLQQSRTPGLADLRVFNAAGESLPLALGAARPETAKRSGALPLFPWPAPAVAAAGKSAALQVQVDAAGAVVRINGTLADGRPASKPIREWLIDASAHADDERLAALTLEWDHAAPSLASGATLEGSDDFNHWQPLARDMLVEFAAAPGAAAVLRNRLSLEGPRAPKYLRLRVDEAVPLRAVQAEWRGSAQTPLDRAPASFVRPAGDGEAAWLLDLQAPIALQRLRIELPQPNTVVLLSVEQRNEGEAHWRTLGTHTLYRLTRGGQELTSPPIALSAPAARHWRLRLDAKSPSLTVPALSAELQWPQTWAVFAARNPAPLQLAIGRERAVPVALPLPTLLPGYREGDEAKLPEATLGVLSAQSPAARGVFERLQDASTEERRRWLLWGLLALAVVGLAWMARALMKDLAAPKPGAQ